MLKLHDLKAAADQPLGVVADQVGCPTSTFSLAKACWRAIKQGTESQLSADFCPRILHWSDSGVASWYDFAVAIGELGVATGLLNRAALVKPLTTAEYPTAAKRPFYSLLDCSDSWLALGLEPLHWHVALKGVLTDLAARNSNP
jgi:dTDP-4-dehydrorhamnose reductase